MGGGDLNLKKAWHPQTMKNQEKVWKAEQVKTREVQKLNELKKEIENEKNREDLKRMGQASGVLPATDGDKKLEWMYKSSTDLVNREEYLLGRSIDKSFEILKAEEEQKKAQNLFGVKKPVNHVEHECIPFSIRSYRNLESNEQVDLQRKLLEDPLMLIKQKEMESRRKLLDNPVKLKEIHRILKTEQMEHKHNTIKKKKAKKLAKKQKKRKQKHHKSKMDDSSSSSSDSSCNTNSDKELVTDGKDLDKELEKRYKKLLNRDMDLRHINLNKLLDAKYETISKELDKAVRYKELTVKKDRSSESHLKGSRITSQNQQIERRTKDERYQRDKHRGTMQQERSHSRTHYSPKRHKSKEEYNSKTKRRRERTRSRTSSRSLSPRNSTYSRSRLKSSTTATTSSEKRSVTNDAFQKLSTEEKEKRLKEMMMNAAWRDKERTKSVQKQREENAREEAQNRNNKKFNKEFINEQFKKAMSNHTSVGSRIRSNLNKIQRAPAAMNTNFMKK